MTQDPFACYSPEQAMIDCLKELERLPQHIQDRKWIEICFSLGQLRWDRVERLDEQQRETYRQILLNLKTIIDEEEGKINKILLDALRKYYASTPFFKQIEAPG